MEEQIRYNLEIKVLEKAKEKLENATIELLSNSHIKKENWKIEDDVIQELKMIDEMINNLKQELK